MGNINSTSDILLSPIRNDQIYRNSAVRMSKILNKQHYVSSKTARAVDRFSTKILQMLYEMPEPKNQAVSCVGIQLLLAMYVDGISSSTDVHSGLELPFDADSENKCDYIALSKKLCSLCSNTFSSGSKIYLKKGSAVPFFLPNFRKVIQNYRTEMECIDFENPFEAAGIMNKWASSKSKNKIKNQVMPYFLRPDMLSTVLNVIYFKGRWRANFDVKDTRNLIFFLDDERAIQKPTMSLYDKKHLRYYESKTLRARILELPYKEKGFRMVIILPDEVNGLADVMQRASKNGLLCEIDQLLHSNIDIHLRLPRFKVEADTDMKILSPKLEGPKIFDNSNRLSDTNCAEVVDQFFQKVIIDVNENGTNVSAATDVPKNSPKENTILQQHILYHADRPFIFLVLYENTVLFIGTYTR